MTLREKVAEALHEHRLTKVGPYGDAFDMPWEFERDTKYGESMREQADAAIEAVFDALLSDTVVEAGARAHVEDTFGEGTWSDMLKDSDPYGIRFDTGSPEMNIRSMEAALKATIAALTADESEVEDTEVHNET